MMQPDFIESVPELITRLKANQWLNASLFTFEEDSLYDIDNILIPLFNNKKIGMNELEEMSLPMLAYCGEVYIRHRGGKWAMVEEKGNYYAIILNNGAPTNLIAMILDTFLYFQEDELPSVSSGYFAIAGNFFTTG